MVGVVARSAVAESDVEISVGTEREVAAVVIRERLRDDPACAFELQVEARRRIRDERIRRPQESRDDGVAIRIREVDEEAAARRVIGREDETEQTALAAARDSAGQIEEIGCERRAAANDTNTAGLLNDELHRAIRRVLHECER
jgi:hypothetical protein